MLCPIEDGATAPARGYQIFPGGGMVRLKELKTVQKMHKATRYYCAIT